jgi:hypothetical protein
MPCQCQCQVALTPPSTEARLAILRLYTRRMPLQPSLAKDPERMREVALRCVGFTGADLSALCREAAMAALEREQESWARGEIEAEQGEGVEGAEAAEGGAQQGKQRGGRPGGRSGDQGGGLAQLVRRADEARATEAAQEAGRQRGLLESEMATLRAAAEAKQQAAERAAAAVALERDSEFARGLCRAQAEARARKAAEAEAAEAEAEAAEAAAKAEAEAEGAGRSGALPPVDPAAAAAAAAASEQCRRTLVELYRVHCPEKLRDGSIAAALGRYAGSEGRLVLQLGKKYGGAAVAQAQKMARARPQAEERERREREQRAAERGHAEATSRALDAAAAPLLNKKCLAGGAPQALTGAAEHCQRVLVALYRVHHPE